MACEEGSFKRADFEFVLEHQLVRVSLLAFPGTTSSE